MYEGDDAFTIEWKAELAIRLVLLMFDECDDDVQETTYPVRAYLYMKFI